MNQRKDRMDAFGATLLIALSALMGLNQVLIKLSNAGFSPVFQAGLRSLCAFFPILIYAWWRNKPLSVRDGSFGPGLLSGTFFATEFLIMFIALDFTSVARVSIFFYTMPVWVAIAAHFLIDGERLNVVRSVGLVTAIVGVVVALTDGSGGMLNQTFVGDMMSLVGGMFWAGIVLVVRTTRLSKSCPEQQLLYQLGVSAVVLLALAPLFGDFFRDMTPMIGFYFAVQVIVIICVGFLLWFWVLSIYPASSTASFSFIAPIFGVLFGHLILDEVLTKQFLVAVALVSIGVVLVNRKGRR